MNEIHFVEAKLNLAPFWPDNPALWLMKTDAQFHHYNIRDDVTKYNYIIANIDTHCLIMVKDIALSPPVTNKYETLKKALLKRLRELSIKNVKKILEAEYMGDRKPSEFLKHLKDLAGPDVGNDYIKSLWSSRLPGRIQWVASFLASASLEKIAQFADLAIKSPTAVFKHSTKDETNPAKPTATNDILRKRVDDLTKRVDDLTLRIDEIQSKTVKTASTLTLLSETSETNINPENIPICWYHQNYSYGAYRCVRPCNFFKRKFL